jgi:2-(1,2-epoxy-1,2-dihydrophenyl)acetyl-CoA isomerase
VNLPPVRRWLAEMERTGNAAEAERRIAAWQRMVDEHGVVRTEIDGRIGYLELSYPPKANALVPPMYKLFVDSLQELEENDDVWVIVLRAAGKHFSSGGFVGEDGFYAGLDAGDNGSAPYPMHRTFVEMFQPMQRRLYNCHKPTIAMINGFVGAEAVDLTLAADIRTAQPNSEMWFSFGYTGNTAYTGSGWLLSRMVGLSKAMELLLTAARLNGEQAHRLGLVNVLAPSAEELAPVTNEIAARIAGLPPVTLRLIKREVHRGLEVASFDSALDLMSMIEPIVQATEDHMDAERAVVEKRAPVVLGR